MVELIDSTKNTIEQSNEMPGMTWLLFYKGKIMIYIGNHESLSYGYLGMAIHEKDVLHGNTFAFFTRNPRGGQSKELSNEDANALINYLNGNTFGKLVAHMPYTLNLCSDKEDIREFSKRIFKEDLLKMEKIPNQYLNFHPGSRLSQSKEVAIKEIIDALNEIIFEDQTTTILLETMAGKGSEVGSTFEEIKEIIDGINIKDKIGVCLDTCHVFDAGYDIKNDLEGVLKKFDEVIGLKYLKAIHLNDSKNILGSHKDRHECLGKGNIGKEAFIKIINEPKFDGLSFILETPNDDLGYKKEIEFVKENSKL